MTEAVPGSPTRAAGVGDALATLDRGAAFLTRRTSERWWAEPWPSGTDGMVRARLLANSLKELDGFLHVVMDAIDGCPARPFDQERRSAAGRLAVGFGAEKEFQVEGLDCTPCSSRTIRSGTTRGSCAGPMHAAARG